MLSRQIDILQKTIRIEQDLSLSHAGTVWDGALVLAYYLAKNQQIALTYFQAKNVVQLGSGTGVLGLIVALFQPKNIFLTDFQEFLPILHKNYEINKQQISAATKVVVTSMKWGVKQDMEKLGHIDFIIGSELAYDVQNIGYLIETFLFFIKANPEVKILINYQKYENPNRNLYQRLCKVTDLKCDQIDSEDMDYEYQDAGMGILLISQASNHQNL